MGKLLIKDHQVLHMILYFYFFFFMAAMLLGSSGGELSDSTAAPMESRERHALYSAIQGFVGKSWNGSDLYPDPCGWTPIQGVSCDFYNGSWYVSTMNIGSVYDNSLTCTATAKFTRHLFHLHHLTSLSFYTCFASPTTTISNLNWKTLSKSLKTLEFRSNPGLTGNLPASIGALTELRSLVILENGLTGELPMEIGKLVNLQKLVLAGNGFSGQIPTTLGRLSQLLILDLSRNNLSGSIPLTFKGLTSLLKLDLSKNRISGSLGFGALKNLTLMDVGSNNLTGGLPETVQEMVSLQEMVVSDNPSLGGDLMKIQWRNLQNLEELELSNTGLTGEIPESITEMKGLRFLGLSQNRLAGTPPAKLSSMASLTALHLNGNNFSGVLGFPEMFYRRMKWRFGGWNNTKLCCRSGLCVPIGIRICTDESVRVHVNRRLGIEVSKMHGFQP